MYLKRLIECPSKREREKEREREREREVGGGREREICATNIKLTLVRKLSIVW